MFKNDLKMALRNIAKQKTFAFINIAGLAVGMACTLLITLWVQDELSYDRFHKNADDIYTVVMDWNRFGGNRSNQTYAPLAPTCQKEIPDVVNSVRIEDLPRIVVKHKNNAFYENGGMIADPSIFSVFSFPVAKGNPQTDLTGPFDVSVSESFAKKYFGDEDPIGKVLEGEGLPMTVKVVMKDIPHNSHLQFDFLLPFELAKHLPHFPLDWDAPNYSTYLQLQKSSNAGDVAQKIAAIVAEHNPGLMQSGVRLFLEPLKDIHLDPQLSSRQAGNRGYVYAFFIIGLFVLGIACINFVNLSTARSSVRSKEIGVRKVVGALKRQLVRQFMTESVVSFLIALGLALVLSQLFLPVLNQLSGKPLSLNIFDYRFMSGMLALMIFLGLLSGSFPAFYLSALKPASILGKNISSSRRGIIFRNALITVQFVLSIFLILSTAIVHSQVRFMQRKNLGFDRDNIVYIPIRDNIKKNYEAIKAELLQNPHILSVTAKDCLPTTHTNRTLGIRWEGKRPDQDKIAAETLKIDYDYFKTLGLEIIEGRDFSKDYPTDAAQAFVLNETAVQKMEIPAPVIGKEFTLYMQKGTIIGILKDAYLKSLHEEIEPQVYHIMNDMTDVGSEGIVLIRMAGRDIPETISSVEKIWNRVNPQTPFECAFLDETYQKLYPTEMRVGTILNYFTVLAIFISCLGMFGLALFAAERRTKEIGVRKVLGASVSGIVALLSRDFIKLVLIANVISWPIAYIFMNRWLYNFAYRVSVGILTFLFAGLIAVIIALLTVGYQSVKAAVANPVDSLRYE